MRFLKILFLLAAYSGPAGAQSGQSGIFHEPSTGLTMRFPVELVLRDAQKSIDEGHVSVFGSMQNEAKAHELARSCMKPILLAELPDQSAAASFATLLLFEFIPSKECRAGFKYKDDEAVVAGIAQTALHLPGATPLSQPLWWDLGKQKLHIAFSAFGLQTTSPGQLPALLTIAALRYHGHIFGWMMSADRLNTFNDLTKTSLELDDGKVYPLVVVPQEVVDIET